jgi:hypothetical protein
LSRSLLLLDLKIARLDPAGQLLLTGDTMMHN